VGATVSEGGVTRNFGYQYNARGIRVGKVVDGVETRYLIDELQPYAQVVEEYDTLGNTKGSYVYGLDLLSRVSGMQPEFYHSDGLGSTRLLTNGTEQVSNTYTYDAYGNLIARVGGSNNPYLFAGQQRDVETGLDYLRARYYDPTLGRFVSADAYEGTLNDPMSLHDYQYAHANPVVFTDPSGYSTNVGELLSNIATHAVLASMAFVGGYGIGAALVSGNVIDAIEIYDKFFAGFADATTFGVSTQLRSQIYGETAIKDRRGAFFNLGRLAGGLAGIAVGAQAPGFGELGQASGAAKAAAGYNFLGTGVGIFQSGKNIMEGRATLWEILPFLPVLGWFNINYKVISVGLGSNGGNIRIIPRNPKAPLPIYRGTYLTQEIEIFQESGYIMSNAAQTAYREARYEKNLPIKRSIQYARKASQKAHKVQLDFWGSLDEYVRAHSGAPDDVRQIGVRSMIFFTTKSKEVNRFMTSESGIIVTREIPYPYALIMPQTWETSNESEVLVLHMIKNVRIIK
jgi:RHS repeat-associated protein